MGLFSWHFLLFSMCNLAQEGGEHLGHLWPRRCQMREGLGTHCTKCIAHADLHQHSQSPNVGLSWTFSDCHDLPSFPGISSPGYDLLECQEMQGSTTHTQELTCYTQTVSYSGFSPGSTGRARETLPAGVWGPGKECEPEM